MTTGSAGPRSRPPVLLAASLAWHACRIRWLAMIGLAVVTGMFAPASAWVTRQIIDAFDQPGRHGSTAIVTLGVAAVLLAVLATAAGLLAGLITESVQRSLRVHVPDRLYAQVERLRGIGWFETPAFQDQLRLAEQAGLAAPFALGSLLAMAVRGLASIGGFAGILLVAWPPMLPILLAAAVPLSLAQLPAARGQTAATQRSMASQRRWFMFRSILTDPGAAKETRLFGLSGHFRAKMADALRDAADTEYAAFRRTAIVQTLMTVAGGLIAAAGTAVVAVQAARGRITVGDFVMFLAAVTGVQGVIGATACQIPVASKTFRLLRHFAAIAEVDDDLPDGGQRVPPLRHAIEFDNVWFRYNGGDWVLRGLSGTIMAGTTVGLVGVNGAGKSTLIKLLGRLYDPQRGRILWDGIDIRSLDLTELRERISATFQDFMVYDLTAAESIGLGHLPSLHDRESVARSARIADVESAIQSLPQGYDTMLSRTFTGAEGSAGTVLSGGLNQRIALARSLMRNPDLFVLDEPSAGLDADAEYRIHQRLKHQFAGCTRLLVSHRLSVIREADHILVLVGGCFAESGNHDQLMAARGTYARLFSLQAAAYQDPRVGPHAVPDTDLEGRLNLS